MRRPNDSVSGIAGVAPLPSLMSFIDGPLKLIVELDLEKSMEGWGLTPADREKAARSMDEFLAETGIDPDKPVPNVFVGDRLYRAGIVDYFRIEALSTVLSFWLVLATFVSAVATLVLAA